MIQEEKAAVQISVNDVILMRLGAVDKSIDELGKRMDRLEKRMDKLEEKLVKLDEKFTSRMDKQDDKIEKLADKIDELRKDIKSSQNHGQIATISAIGIGLSAVSITLGVLYALIFK